MVTPPDVQVEVYKAPSLEQAVTPTFTVMPPIEHVTGGLEILILSVAEVQLLLVCVAEMTDVTAPRALVHVHNLFDGQTGADGGDWHLPNEQIPNLQLLSTVQVPPGSARGQVHPVSINAPFVMQMHLN